MTKPSGHENPPYVSLHRGRADYAMEISDKEFNDFIGYIQILGDDKSIRKPEGKIIHHYNNSSLYIEYEKGKSQRGQLRVDFNNSDSDLKPIIEKSIEHLLKKR